MKKDIDFQLYLCKKRSYSHESLRDGARRLPSAKPSCFSPLSRLFTFPPAHHDAAVARERRPGRRPVLPMAKSTTDHHGRAALTLAQSIRGER